MEAPSYQAHIPKRPTQAQYQALVEEFWWSATYVARSLWREELIFLEVGNALSYPYPQQVDEQVSAYLEAIREMPPPH